MGFTQVSFKRYVMAHPKVKDGSSIVTILQPVLQLNPQQVKLLEQLEYEWYRSYQFDVPKFHSSKVATMQGLRQFLPILQNEQKGKLKGVLQEKKEEQNIYDQADMERRTFKRLIDGLKFLALRPDQEKLIHQIWEEKGYIDKEESLEQLESTLDSEQFIALKQYQKKQARLFREGQENHVRFVFEYLALEEKQFQEVVEYHIKNYWRNWLPAEELKEEAELMRKILNQEQWKKYSADWDKQMASVKKQMVTDEEGNKFNLLWVKGLYEYTRDILLPKYLTYRQGFEQHLRSEERILTDRIREKVKEFNQVRLQKGYGSQSSTLIESNRIWVARANLMPSVGSKGKRELEEDLKKIVVEHAQTLNEYFVKLKETDKAYREFTANFYEEIGGTDGPNVMVHREEEERAAELWKMNFLLVDPNHKPD